MAAAHASLLTPLSQSATPASLPNARQTPDAASAGADFTAILAWHTARASSAAPPRPAAQAASTTPAQAASTTPAQAASTTPAQAASTTPEQTPTAANAARPSAAPPAPSLLPSMMPKATVSASQPRAAGTKAAPAAQPEGPAHVTAPAEITPAAIASAIVPPSGAASVVVPLSAVKCRAAAAAMMAGQSRDTLLATAGPPASVSPDLAPAAAHAVAAGKARAARPQTAPAASVLLSDITEPGAVAPETVQTGRGEAETTRIAAAALGHAASQMSPKQAASAHTPSRADASVAAAAPTPGAAASLLRAVPLMQQPTAVGTGGARATAAVTVTVPMTAPLEATPLAAGTAAAPKSSPAASSPACVAGTPASGSGAPRPVAVAAPASGRSEALPADIHPRVRALPAAAIVLPEPSAEPPVHTRSAGGGDTQAFAPPGPARGAEAAPPGPARGAEATQAAADTSAPQPASGPVVAAIAVTQTDASGTSGGRDKMLQDRLDAVSQPDGAAAPATEEGTQAGDPTQVSAALPAPADTAAPAGALPAPAAAPPALQLAQAVAGVHVAAGAQGQVTIHLQPGELGAVQVKIARAPDGTATVSVQVEKSATLQTLQQDISHLHQALDRAGVPSEQRQVTFHLAPPSSIADSGAGGGNGHGAGGGPGGQGPGQEPGPGPGPGGGFSRGGQPQQQSRGQHAAQPTPTTDDRDAPRWQPVGVNITA